MALTFERVAVIGATGPTGRALVRELVGRGVPVRAVARDAARLASAFPYDPIARQVGDARDPASLAAATAGCDAIVDCIGLPGRQFAEHVVTARNIAAAAQVRGVRTLQVSGYWSYMPIREIPLSETHPRKGGPPWAVLRREAEDILRDAGAAILHLPDFFGPWVHTGTLQMALIDAVTERPMRWIGRGDVARDYIFVPDAMRIAAELLVREEAAGSDWIAPGSGPITGCEVAEIVGGIVGRPVRLRAAGLTLLRLVGLINGELSRFVQMAPAYVKPISFAGDKLEGLIGPQPRAGYAEAIGRTIGWLRQA